MNEIRGIYDSTHFTPEPDNFNCILPIVDIYSPDNAGFIPITEAPLDEIGARPITETPVDDSSI